MTFDHHTQLIRATKRGRKATGRWAVGREEVGSRHIHTCPVAMSLCLCVHMSWPGMQLGDCMQTKSNGVSTSLHNQTQHERVWELGDRREEQGETLATSQRNKQKGRAAKMPENPHILRCSHFACNASNFSEMFSKCCCCIRCCCFCCLREENALADFVGKLKMNL